MSNNQDSLSSELADDTKLLAASLGGPRGMFESGAPSILFVSVYALNGNDLRASVVAALITGVVLAVLRFVQRQELTQVFAGFIGLGISAFIATKTGNAQDFFLPGILTNIAYTAVCLISIAINKPILGYLLESLKPTDSNWLKSKALVKRYRAITFLWTGVFLIRALIMTPLYFANQTVALGFFKLALGWPLFALAAYATYAISKRKVNL